MKFFINNQEVTEEKFIELFLSQRVMQDEEDNLSLTFLRAMLPHLFDLEKRISIERTVGLYEIRRLFKGVKDYTIGNLHFQIIEEPKEEQENADDVSGE